jgi:peptidoglycan/xylan/chitin deacetylase (PgdA/CDA1 family)
MKRKLCIREIISRIFDCSGFFNAKITSLARSGASAILMYHRIVNPSSTGEILQDGMYVKPNTFLKHLDIIKKYFIPVSLCDLITNPKKIGDKPICAITFDDGWLDFLTNAYPALLKYKIPSTVFLPTRFIGTTNRFWTDHLSLIVSNLTAFPRNHFNRKKDTLHPLSLSVCNLTGNTHTKLERAIALLKPYPSKTINTVLDELLSLYAAPIAINRSFLNWNEIKYLKNEGLVTFGSHTENHAILSTLSSSDICNELINSRKTLLDRNVTDQDFIPFCYPNGNHADAIVKLVKESGYHLAVTTKKGWILNNANPFTLNRIGMHQDISSSNALTLSRLTLTI